jgi:hypothetical protein
MPPPQFQHGTRAGRPLLHTQPCVTANVPAGEPCTPTGRRADGSLASSHARHGERPARCCECVEESVGPACRRSPGGGNRESSAFPAPRRLHLVAGVHSLCSTACHAGRGRQRSNTRAKAFQPLRPSTAGAVFTRAAPQTVIARNSDSPATVRAAERGLRAMHITAVGHSHRPIGARASGRSPPTPLATILSARMVRARGQRDLVLVSGSQERRRRTPATALEFDRLPGRLLVRKPAIPADCL